MDTSDVHYRLETIVYSTGGREYTVTLRAHPREDGRWEGSLEFLPIGGSGKGARTPVQTTQSSLRQLLYWAGGLSRTHLEDSLMSALYPVKTRPAPPLTAPRVRDLAPVERVVLEAFRAARTTRLSTDAIFGRAPYANGDFVRAFEELEKQWRYVVRHTAGGVDWVELTIEGARAAGITAMAAGDQALEPPKSPR